MRVREGLQYDALRKAPRGAARLREAPQRSARPREAPRHAPRGSARLRDAPQGFAGLRGLVSRRAGRGRAVAALGSLACRCSAGVAPAAARVPLERATQARQDRFGSVSEDCLSLSADNAAVFSGKGGSGKRDALTLYKDGGCARAPMHAYAALITIVPARWPHQFSAGRLHLARIPPHPLELAPCPNSGRIRAKLD